MQAFVHTHTHMYTCLHRVPRHSISGIQALPCPGLIEQPKPHRTIRASTAAAPPRAQCTFPFIWRAALEGEAVKAVEVVEAVAAVAPVVAAEVVPVEAVPAEAVTTTGWYKEVTMGPLISVLLTVVEPLTEPDNVQPMAVVGVIWQLTARTLFCEGYLLFMYVTSFPGGREKKTYIKERGNKDQHERVYLHAALTERVGSRRYALYQSEIRRDIAGH
jgi:hypothetical protein